MLYAKHFFIYCIVPTTFYPLYFFTANGLDTLAGSQGLLYWLKYESLTQLIKIFLSDWLASLPLMLGLLYLLILPVEFLSKKIGGQPALLSITASVMIAVIASYLLNFSPVELFANALAMLFFTSFYLSAKKWLL